MYHTVVVRFRIQYGWQASDQLNITVHTDTATKRTIQSHHVNSRLNSYAHGQPPSSTHRPVKKRRNYFPVLLFFLGRASPASPISSSSSPPSASSIAASLSLPLLSWSESNSSATSESVSVWKSSSGVSESSSAEPRSGRPPSSLDPMSSLTRAAAMRDLCYIGQFVV